MRGKRRVTGWDVDDGLAAHASGRVPAARGRTGVRAGRLSDQASAHRRALPGRWVGRHALPHCRRQARRGLGPDRDRRQPPRRRRQCRRRDRLSSRARRLHAAVQPARPAVDQPQSLQDAAVRLDEVRADHRAGGRAQRHHRPRRPAGQQRAGADRVRQGQSRQGDLRLAGQRLDLASVGADAGDHGRHRNGARALQGRGSGADRHHGRPGRYLRRQHRRGAALRESRAGEVPGRHQPSTRSPVAPDVPTPPRSACPT